MLDVPHVEYATRLRHATPQDLLGRVDKGVAHGKRAVMQHVTGVDGPVGRDAERGDAGAARAPGAESRTKLPHVAAVRHPALDRGRPELRELLIREGEVPELAARRREEAKAQGSSKVVGKLLICRHVGDVLGVQGRQHAHGDAAPSRLPCGGDERVKALLSAKMGNGVGAWPVKGDAQAAHKALKCVQVLLANKKTVCENHDLSDPACLGVRHDVREVLSKKRLAARDNEATAAERGEKVNGDAETLEGRVGKNVSLFIL